jgi:hypothetical protein
MTRYCIKIFIWLCRPHRVSEPVLRRGHRDEESETYCYAYSQNVIREEVTLRNANHPTQVCSCYYRKRYSCGVLWNFHYFCKCDIPLVSFSSSYRENVIFLSYFNMHDNFNSYGIKNIYVCLYHYLLTNISAPYLGTLSVCLSWPFKSETS